MTVIISPHSKTIYTHLKKHIMKKLLSAYNFTQNLEYYYMIHESYVNGQFSQAHEQIKEMPKKNKKDLLNTIIFSMSDISKQAKEWIIKHTIEVI